MSVNSELRECLAGIPSETLAVAVSGGGDSVALLHLLSKYSGVRAVTVDHGLRPESADEAAGVATLCNVLNIPHTTLKWQDWDRSGNLQNAARNARLDLISAWAKDAGVTHVALGHTLDDQAETVLMRLVRGSGVDGLSGMAAARVDGAVTWLRPLLNTGRQELREYLRDQAISWIDDPSNDDPRYDRVKTRQVLAQLSVLGLSATGLVETATRMQSARVALELQTLELSENCGEITECGEVILNQTKFLQAPPEIQHRLLAAALMWVSGQPYRPRFDSLRAVLTNPDGQTLHGCIVRQTNGKIVIRRELARTAPPQDVSDKVWDGRWVITKQAADQGCKIAALGVKGLQQCENWRESGIPREVLLTTPAIWSGGELIAAPNAGFANGWEIMLKNGIKGFNDALITR